MGQGFTPNRSDVRFILRQIRIAEQRENRLRHGGRITRRNEQRMFAVGEEFGNASDGGSGDGESGGHGFENHIWRAFAERRQREQVGGFVERLRGRLMSGPIDPVGHVQRLRQGLE